MSMLSLAGLLTLLHVTSGCRSAQESSMPQPVVEKTPDDVLQDMLQAYRRAPAYSDRGVLCLRYEQRGTRFHDEAPLAVVVDSGNRLRVHAYQAAIVCDGKQLMAHVADPAEGEMGEQVLVVPAPPTLTLDRLLADPILNEAVTGGAGRLPIQLELLLGEDPLESILREEVKKRFLPETRIEGHACHAVEVQTVEGHFVFWIDKGTFLLRRLEYPAKLVPAELGAVKPHLVAEFRLAKFASTAAVETFQVVVSPEVHPVAAFVVPPPSLASPLLGQRVQDFRFLNPLGEDVSADRLLGRVAVLLWFSDHPACRTALQQLEVVRNELDSPQVAMYAVCAESSQRSHQDLAALMREWGVQVPLVRDLRAFGRDLFDLPGAPALVVLDATGVVQVFEVGANPNMADELPAVLKQILAGANVAEATRAQYEANLAKFRAAIQ